ncbi:MAG: hypothetical protein D6674_00750 [Acidobacteria bacterium]|nr:MAG: hypothetical protein D6674_00750 [Acidobacteriota bacterium]
MEWIILIIALVALLWRIKKENDEALGYFEQDGPTGTRREENEPYRFHSERSLGFWETSSAYMSDDENSFWHLRSYDDDHGCDITRAYWEPSCPLYWSLNNDSHCSWDS